LWPIQLKSFKKKGQIEAARIFCGFPCYASIASIYKETRWDKVKVRREVKMKSVCIISHFENRSGGCLT
jgi:hypothetical protein